jgi:[acyl-carrier-protein] S-malonyltransferase
MVASGVTHIVECGPGKVLAGLNKRIVPETPTHTFNDETAFRETLRILK